MNDAREQLELLRSIEARLARLEERVMFAAPAAEIAWRSAYSCRELAALTKTHGVQPYKPFTLRLACADGRIPEAEKRENGHWSVPRCAVERILSEGVPPERREDGAGTRLAPERKEDDASDVRVSVQKTTSNYGEQHANAK